MKRSLWLGALVAPLAAPLAYMAAMALLPDPTPKDDRTFGAMFITLIVFLLPASYTASLVFGGPLVYLLRRFEKLSFWWVVLLAAPLGAAASVCGLYILVAFFGATISWNQVQLSEAVIFISVGAADGFVTAGVFCLLGGINAQPDAPQSALNCSLKEGNTTP